jgi:hypothetical protein
MRVKHLASKNTMAKGTTTSATSWVRSAIAQKEVEKARTDGLISSSDSIKFPSTERIPQPSSGYRVMFLAFLFRGLSLPAHEFLRGLLFVYGVQLHQLTPNSILHIACFVTLCESFLGIEPHFLLWRLIFRLRPNVAQSYGLRRLPDLGHQEAKAVVQGGSQRRGARRPKLEEAASRWPARGEGQATCVRVG